VTTQGFHIAASWGLLAGPSGAIYGTVGSGLRNYYTGILNEQLAAVGKDKPPQASIDSTYSKKPKVRTKGEKRNRFFSFSFQIFCDQFLF
jgi:hypothetical protein